MRLQTIYVDLRPLVAKWLGLALLFTGLALAYLSLKPDVLRTLTAAAGLYRSAGQHATFSGQFGELLSCLQLDACRRALGFTWSAPLLVKSTLLGVLSFAALLSTFGLLWRPEIIAMRDTRVRAHRAQTVRSASPAPPRRAL